jgi:hypothetical protein
LVTVAGLLLFIYFGGIPGSSGGGSFTQTITSISSNTAPVSETHLENPHQIVVTNSQTQPNSPVQEVPNSQQFKSPASVDASGSRATNNP